MSQQSDVWYFYESKARYINIERLKAAWFQPELLYFATKIDKEAVDTDLSGGVDKNWNPVQ